MYGAIIIGSFEIFHLECCSVDQLYAFLNSKSSYIRYLSIKIYENYIILNLLWSWSREIT